MAFERNNIGGPTGIVFVAAAGFLLLVPTAEAADADAINARIAQGIVAIARDGNSHNPRQVARLLRVNLNNPEKWLEQPEGTFRVARWKYLKNQSGISSVELNDVPVAQGKEIASTTDLTFNATHCLSIRSIERAAGMKASYGGMAYQMILDAPSAPFTQLGREHARITVGSTSIAMLANKPGPKGCLINLSFQRTRATRSSR